MQLIRSARRALRALPPPLVAAALVVLQLLAVAALGRGQGWSFSHRDEAIAAALLAIQVVLLYAVAILASGRIGALLASLVLVGGPVVLGERYFVVGGSPSTDYKAVYRQSVLPTSFGLTSRDGLIAACLLLASAWLALARLRPRVPLWAAAAASGAAAAAAVLVFPRIWPALAAPALALVSTRRLAPVAAAAGTAAAGLVLLAVFRHVPHIALGWHQSGKTTDSIREFSWSRRILEFLPLGGLVGLARRSASAAAFFGTVLLVAVILPLSRPLNLNEYLTTIVPGLPAYWLLAASIPFLVPRPRPVTSRAASTAATGR